jgi:gliding motility-associated-like protein
MKKALLLIFTTLLIISARAQAPLAESGFAIAKISGSNLRFTSATNFEPKKRHSLSVPTSGTDGFTYDEALDIKINKSKSPPTNITLSATAIIENVAANTTIGTFSTTDPDAGNTFTYILAPGAGNTNNNAFTISGNSLRIVASPDYETKNSYSIRVRTTDQGGESFEKIFTITITDQPEFNVTTINDTGAGSLRTAMTSANSSAGNALIRFNISSGSAPFVISIGAALPNIAQTVTIDGTTQSGYLSAAAPVIEIKKNGAGSTGFIITAAANGCTIKGLSITGFTSSGINISSDNNVIAGNYIGIKPDGSTILANGTGITINSGSIDNLIGGSTDAARNVISGNTVNGIYVNGVYATGNKIQHNYIGTNAAGTALAANGVGINLFNNKLTIVGTNSDGIGDEFEGNVISGNSSDGISISEGLSHVIAGNYIGTNASGTAALKNTNHGISIINGAVYNIIGGLTAEARNIISGNGYAGVNIESSQNEIYNNYIGTNPAGGTAIPNCSGSSTYSNIHVVGGSSNTIGSLIEGKGNLISGSLGYGIFMSGTSYNTIIGNVIGLNASGTAKLKNTYEGIAIYDNVSNVTIGGSTSGARNVISGNQTGISIGKASNIKVQGNLIGLDPTGATAMGNTSHGVAIGTSTTGILIGTDANGVNDEAERNIISGNSNGVFVADNGRGIVAGNYIGTNTTGTAAIPNTTAGVKIESSQFAEFMIGGELQAAGNLIAGNGIAGIALDGNYCTVKNNTIGKSGIVSNYGIFFNYSAGSPAFNIISKNTISYHNSSGIALGGGSGNGNLLSQNSIHHNNFFGIDLGLNGLTGNDTEDEDNGPNKLINFPIITNVVIAGGSTTISGTIDMEAATATYTVELFANSTTSNAGYGQGEIYLGNVTVPTNATGHGDFSRTFAGTYTNLSATATDASNNTSEFSLTKVINIAPTNITLSALTINENVAAGTQVGTLSSTDINVGNTFTYSLVTGTGDTNNGAFDIVGASLKIKASPDYETKNSYSVRIRTTDQDGLFYEKEFTITINNLLDTYVVTNTLNSGVGSLFDAISKANSSAGSGFDITFNIPGPGPFLIAPTTALPNINRKANLDATTQPGYETSPRIEINGGGILNNGITVGNNGNTIKGFSITGFTNAGISINSDNNFVSGNYLGVKPDGITAAGNKYGVYVNDYSNYNLIGGPSAALNIISGNTDAGIYITGTHAGDNKIQHNYIGTNPSGTGAIPNGQNGVWLNFTTSVIIGADDDGINDALEKNVISGNTSDGITLFSSTSSKIVGNYIGTNATGTSVLKNGSHGISITNESSFNTVGGLLTESRNIISGNGKAGIVITSPINSVYNNYIGTDITGNTAIPNSTDNATFANVWVSGSSTYSVTIGSTIPGKGNLISGSATDGIYLSNATSTSILGNIIGLNAAGTEQLKNNGKGVSVNACTNINIGHGLPGTGNVIAGNQNQGIYITAGANINVQGNMIGLNAAGTAAIANGGSGVEIQNSSANIVVGTNADGVRDENEPNIISGNAAYGINLLTAASGTIAGNYIGTNATGTAAVPNALGGLRVDALQTTAITIGGNTLPTGNLIAGNTDVPGIILEGNLATIKNNIIGKSGLANGSGIVFRHTSGTPANHKIVNNTISYNTGTGINLKASTGTGNLISQNSIHHNTNLGIDLDNNDVSNNDAGDVDTGPNNLVNFPVITSVTVAEGSTTITGTIDMTAAAATYTVELFTNSTTYTPANGQGETYLDNVSVTTNAAGHGAFTKTIVGSFTNISATLTDEVNNTSEFALTKAANTVPTDITLSANSINENAAADATVGNFTTTDTEGGTMTYTLVSGTGDTNNTAFNISGSSLRITASPDYETKNSYSVRIRTTDQGGLWYEKVFTISINDVDESLPNTAPTNITLSANSINENAAADATIGNLTSTDPDAGNTFTYSLVSGTGDTDNSAFNISAGNLTIKASPDYETKNSYTVRIRTTDQGGLWYEKSFVITIGDVNESLPNAAPTNISLSAGSINENTAAGSAIVSLSTTDADAGNTFTYSLASGTGDTDNGAFDISGNSLTIKASPDYETKNSYTVRIRTTDQGGLWYEKSFVISINNINEAPTNIALSPSSIDEHKPNGTDVGTFSATDPDAGNTFNYELVSGTGDSDNSAFTVILGGLRLNGSANYSVKSSYSVRVKVTDQGGLTFEKALIIAVNDLPDDNTPPTITSVNVPTPGNYVTGEKLTFTVHFSENISINVSDDGAFIPLTIGSTTRNAYYISGEGTKDLVFEYTVIASDLDINGITYGSFNANGNGFSDAVGNQADLAYNGAGSTSLVNVNGPANTAPTNITLSASSINENAAADATVGNFTTTDADAGNTFIYSLVTGTGDTDNASFDISGSSLKIKASPDYETKNSYTVRIRTTDQGGLWYEKTFIISISDVDETLPNTAPTNITLSANSINENAAADATVGNFTTIDADAGNTFIYSLVTGTGDTDNNAFDISGNSLKVKASTDYETKNSYTVRIRTTDQGGLSFEKSFTIAVNDIAELVFATTTLPNATVASSYFQQIDVSGGSGSYSFAVTSGTLPIGITLANDGKLSGTPSEGGSFNATITVIDQNNVTGAYAYSLIVSPPILVLTATLPNATVGTLYNQTIVATGATTPYSYAVTFGTLPPGFSLSSAGAITGIPTLGGAFNFSVTATDASTGTGPYTLTKAYALVVDPAVQTISFASSGTVTYGDADFNPAATSTNQSINITYSSSDNSIATIVANKIHIVKAGTVTIYADQAANLSYSAAAQKQQILTINPKTLTASLTGIVSKAYNGTTSATLVAGNFSVAGMVGADDVKIAAPITGAYQNKNVGTAKLVTVAGLSLLGADAANYQLATNSISATIGEIVQKTITLTLNVIPTITKVYDGSTVATLVGANYSLIGVENGDAVDATGTSTYDNRFAGTGKIITVTGLVLGGSDKDNYKLSTNTATTSGFINAKPVTLTLNASPAITKTYDGTSAAILAATNYSLIGLVSGDVVAVNGIATYNDATANTGKPITANAFVLGGADKDNYSLTTSIANTTGTIAKANLMITADNKTRAEFTSDPVFTGSYVGFVNAETNAILTSQPTFSTTATISSAPGNYPIIPAAAAAQNYNISYINGTLNISAGGPTSIAMAQVVLLENKAVGTLAGTLSSTSNNPSATYTYTLVGGVGDTDNSLFAIAGNQLNTAIMLNYEQKTSYSIRVRSTSQNGLSLERALTISLTDVNEAPTFNTIANQSFCSDGDRRTITLAGINAGPEIGQTTTFTVTSSNASLFSELMITNNGLLNYKTADGKSGVVTLTVTIKDNGGTANGGIDTYSQSFTVTINPLPEVAITTDNGKIELSKGETLVLKASGGTTYNWVLAQGIIGNRNTAALTIRPDVTTTYTVEAINASGCSALKSITITVKEDFIVVKGTNILSPNGDGKNDRFVIRNIDMYPNNEVKIYDRAGRLLFSKVNYTDQFDGTFRGAPLAEDTYYYIVDFGPSKLKLKGFITIVRD